MTELDPEEEAVLESARRALSPPDVVTQRMRAALLAKIAAPGIVVGASAAASSAAAASAAGSATATTATAATVASAGSAVPLAAAAGGAALGAKVAVGAVFLKAAGVTTAVLLATVTSSYWLPEANAPAPMAAPVVAAPGPRTAPAATARGESAPPPGIESADAKASAPQSRTATAPAPSEAAPRSLASSATPDQRLEAELDVLRRAQQAIQAGQARLALGLLTKLDAEHPKSSLRQEREIARVLALCGVGQVATARQVAQQALAASPNSLYAGRIQASCAALPKPGAVAPPAEAPAPGAKKSTPGAPSVARFGDSGN